MITTIENIPESFFPKDYITPYIFIYDFKMTEDAIKSKVNLTTHMFSFLQTGNKKVHLEDSFIEVNNKQSVLIKSGNCLMTELLENDQLYFCKLLFFTNKNVTDFLTKYALDRTKSVFNHVKNKSLFIIENDDFIHSFVHCISTILHFNSVANRQLLYVKFEEIMLYLTEKYQDDFVEYLYSLISQTNNIPFRKIIESNDRTNLNLNELAFLYNMSLSTFKTAFGTYSKDLLK